MRRFRTIFSPIPWLVVAVLLNLSGIGDGIPVLLFLEKLATVAVLGTTFAMLMRSPELRQGVEGKVTLLMVLLLGLAPLASSMVGAGDLRVLMHPGYRYLLKFLLVVVCWTFVMRTRSDARLALQTMLIGYMMLAVVALYRFLVLHEIDPDIGRMALDFRHGDPNFLCLHMAGGAALACWRLASSEGSSADRIWSGLSVVGLALFVTTAWFTTSRGGLLAITVEIVLILGLMPARVTRAARFVAFGLAMVGVFLWDGQRLLNRLEFAHDASAEGRVASVKAGFNGLSKNPFFGVGFDRASTLMKAVGTDFRFLTTEGGITIHNSFLQIGAELGMIGLLIYGTCLVFLVTAIRRAYLKGELRLAWTSGAWTVAALLAMSGLPLGYNATLLGSLLLLFAALRASSREQRLEPT